MHVEPKLLHDVLEDMSATIDSGTPRTTRRPVMRTMTAGLLLVFAAAIAPICALMIACSMPCCEGKSLTFMVSPVRAACMDHCGITNESASHELPAALAAASETPELSFAALAIAALPPHTVTTSVPPRLPARAEILHHAIPGDAPLHLYNSVFLI